MAFKAIILCASALLVQSALSQCFTGAGLGAGGLGYGGGYGLGGAGLGLGGAGYGLGGAGYGLGGLGGAGCGCGGVASTGGGLIASSASPAAPIGISVQSENAYEGTLCAGGNLPFLGTVGVEGVLPTAGGGSVSYGCGNGNVGIAGEAGSITTGITTPQSYAPSLGGIGNGLGGCGGCGGCGGLGGAGLGYGAGLGGYGAGLGGFGGGLGGW